MKDFESFVKTYSTRDFIYFFSQKSIEIYKEHIHSSKKFGCCGKHLFGSNDAS